MIVSIDSLEQLQQLINAENAVYFRLTGGLGNQLFGLSEAHQIHQSTNKRILIDLGAIEHTHNKRPDWMNWARTQKWMKLIQVPLEISSNLQLVNIGSTDGQIDFSTQSLFTGWRFSTARVRKSGLFKEGQFPFGGDLTEKHRTALHLRVGDYVTSKGIGVLDFEYFDKAMEIIGKEKSTTVFSDDNFAADLLVKKLNLKNAEISNETGPLSILSQIARSTYIVASNSTLSWWGIYFSKAEEIVCPKPFYLQEWNFDKDAKFSNVVYLNRFKNKFQWAVTWLLWRMRSIHFRH